jgi:hypothetical protein
MVWVLGGEFLMGSEDFYPEERPVRQVAVDGLWMDEQPVTVAEFRHEGRLKYFYNLVRRQHFYVGSSEMLPERDPPGAVGV